MRKIFSLFVLFFILPTGCSDDNTIYTSNTDWTAIFDKYEQHVFIVGILFSDTSGPYFLNEVGTAFRAEGGRYFTNSHVALVLDKQSSLIIPEWLEPPFYTTLAMVPSGGSLGDPLILHSYALHPYYDYTLESPDLAEIWLQNDPGIKDGIPVAASSVTDILKVGSEIATIGFPGETSDFNLIYPRATLKTGIITSLRPFLFPYSHYDEAYMVEYNLDITGGTSGSPVFNTDGQLIAVHYAGFSNTAIDYGIRADLLGNFSGVITKTIFSDPGTDPNEFLIVPGSSVGAVTINSSLNSELPNYEITVGNIQFFTDNFSYRLQALPDTGTNIKAIRIYFYNDYYNYAYEPPFYTEQHIGIYSSLDKITSYYTPSDIVIDDLEINGETVRATILSGTGITFIHSTYSSYVKEIFVYEPNYAINYNDFYL